MTPPDGYVTKERAAEELNVSLSTLKRMVKHGSIIPRGIPGHGRQQYFLLADLQLLQLTSRERGTDLREVKAIALQALAAARLAEQRLDSVFAFLGIDAPPLQRDADSVRGLYKEARQGGQLQVRDPVWLRYWGNCFFAMDDVYLELVETVTGEGDPWQVFISFSIEIARALQDEPEVRRSLHGRFFESARRNLIHAAYVHCHRSKGRKYADATFRGDVGAVDELVAILRG